MYTACSSIFFSVNKIRDSASDANYMWKMANANSLKRMQGDY